MMVGLTTEQVTGLVSQKAELQGLEERRPVSQHHLQECDPSDQCPSIACKSVPPVKGSPWSSASQYCGLIMLAVSVILFLSWFL